ncbi:MAG: IPExxxVDY family protein [Bacteroidales bacterium]
MKVTKHTLSYSSSGSQPCVLAVASRADEFGFCNLLRTELGIDLSVQEQGKTVFSDGSEEVFPIYSYYDEQTKTRYEMVVNAVYNNKKIVPFLDTISFFLQCNFHEYADDMSEYIIRRIKNIDSILFVQKIEHGKYSQKQRVQLRKLFSYV